VTAATEKARFLRALAFEIHRKRPPQEALSDCIEQEGRGGRHRQFRQAQLILESDGVLAALRAADLVGAEAAAIFAPAFAQNDHRLLAAMLNKLADFHDNEDG
jgi:hypothetical protein